MLADVRPRKPGPGWAVTGLVLVAMAIYLLHAGVGPRIGLLPLSEASEHGEQSIVDSLFWLALALACFRRARRSDHWLASKLTIGIALTLAGLLAVFAAYTSYTKSSMSSYTQAHGMQEMVKTPTANNITFFTTALSRPVAGHTSTGVLLPYLASFSGGSPMTVLVNPQDPRFAELPGEPYQTALETDSAIAFAVIALALGIADIVPGARRQRQPDNARLA